MTKLPLCSAHISEASGFPRTSEKHLRASENAEEPGAVVLGTPHLELQVYCLHLDIITERAVGNLKLQDYLILCKSGMKLCIDTLQKCSSESSHLVVFVVLKLQLCSVLIISTIQRPGRRNATKYFPSIFHSPHSFRTTKVIHLLNYNTLVWYAFSWCFF